MIVYKSPITKFGGFGVLSRYYAHLMLKFQPTVLIKDNWLLPDSSARFFDILTDEKNVNFERALFYHTTTPRYFLPQKKAKLNACITVFEQPAIPQLWRENIDKKINEIWVPSQYNQRILLKTTPGAKVKLIRPMIPIQKTDKKPYYNKMIEDDIFVFLVIGDWNFRKQISKIVETFVRRFTSEKVALVIKTQKIGLNKQIDFSEPQKEIKRIVKEVSSLHPPVFFINKILSDEEIEALFNRKRLALVVGSLNEGLHLPTIYALKYDVPVIAPNHSVFADDYKDVVFTYDIACRRSFDEMNRLSQDYLNQIWDYPDFNQLGNKMKEVYERDLRAVSHDFFKRLFSPNIVYEQCKNYFKRYNLW